MTPRRLRITYNLVATGDTLANGSELILHEIHSLRKDESIEVSWSAILAAPAGVDAADFAADVAILEAAWRVPRKILVVQNLDTTSTPVATDLIRADPTTPTVLSPVIRLDKPGGPHDTLTSRLYRVTFRGGLPSTLTGTSVGLLDDFSYTVTFDSSCRGTLNVSGTYTAASSGVLAQAILSANIDARVAAITTALGGVWAILTNERTPDDLDHLVRFTRTYKELIIGETTGTVSYANLRDQTLTITRSRTGSDGDPGERPLQRFAVSYTADVCKTATTDLLGLWEGTLRPAILERVRTIAGSTIAVVREDPGLSFAANKIRASMEIVTSEAGESIKLLVTVDESVDLGAIIRKVWPTEVATDQDPAPAYVFAGARTLERTTTTVRTVLGAADTFFAPEGGGLAGLAPNQDAPPDAATEGPDLETPGGTLLPPPTGVGALEAGGRYVRKSVRTTTTPRTLGLQDSQFLVTDQTTVLVEEFVIAPTPGGAGGDEQPEAQPRKQF
jgi:hypothetical protein